MYSLPAARQGVSVSKSTRPRGEVVVQVAWGVPEAAVPYRRPRRVAVWGTVALVASLAWLAAGRALIDFARPRPALLIVGWGVLRDTVHLGGHALGAFRAGLAMLWLALLLAALTDGFRATGRWAGVAAVVVGLVGALAAAPLLLVVAVIAGNVVLWGLLGLLGLLLFMALCLRILTAPFRRVW